jgi:hypothetical protein
LPGSLRSQYLRVDVLELRIAVGVMRTLIGLAVAIFENILDFRARCASRASLNAALHESASGPGCVKSPSDAMILQVNRQGVTDVRLRGGDRSEPE